MVETDGNTDDGDEELADQHTSGSNDEKRTTTESFNSPEGERSGSDVDGGEDHGDGEWVADGAGGLEEGG